MIYLNGFYKNKNVLWQEQDMSQVRHGFSQLGLRLKQGTPVEHSLIYRVKSSSGDTKENKKNTYRNMYHNN